MRFSGARPRTTAGHKITQPIVILYFRKIVLACDRMRVGIEAALGRLLVSRIVAGNDRT